MLVEDIVGEAWEGWEDMLCTLVCGEIGGGCILEGFIKGIDIDVDDRS